MRPLKTTALGHKFINVATDYLTKWIELRPIPSKDCEVVAQFFFDDIIVQYGSPREILTDNGIEFCNALVDIVAIHMGTKHTTTSPYHSQCNDLTEHFNPILCMLLEENRDYEEWWHTSLQAILFAYHTSVHSSTRYSPFKLLYGQKPMLPMAPVPVDFEVREPTDLDGYVEACMLQRAYLSQQAQRNISKAQQLQKEGHDKRIRFTRKFKPSDLVAYQKEKRYEKKGKFQAKYVGPYIISEYDKARHKFPLVPLRSERELIAYVVPYFNLMSCELETDLTNINIQG